MDSFRGKRNICSRKSYCFAEMFAEKLLVLLFYFSHLTFNSFLRLQVIPF